MDVTQSDFRKELLPFLRHISHATFVTFDLEMSGITTRPKFSSGDRSHDVGRPTLQQQYVEMKSAAETFQILQIGITCVEEDREKEYYIARPYNFNVSPLSADGVDLRLERTFQFSSSACDFLSKNRFDFGKVFTAGVPYLSRDEEAEILEEYASRTEKNAKIADIIIPANEPTTLEFYRNARKTISAWVKDPKPEYSFVNVGSTIQPLNGYQRRLIHQLVRNEFPTLRAIARASGSFMQMELLDVAREAQFQKKKAIHFHRLISKQKGMRWIFEALAGGDLSGIEPDWFCDRYGEKPEDQFDAKKGELDAVVEALKRKNHVIVGHNLFTDLGFIYKFFKGVLPRRVEHFQQDIHELFPMVIDTKYLATQGNDAMNTRSNLKELLEPFKKIHCPLVVLHERHSVYGATFGKDHEAGFDSWMTAELFVKLAAQCFANRKTEMQEQGLLDVTNLVAPDSEAEDCMTFSDSEDDDDSSAEATGGVRLFSPNPFQALRKAKKPSVDLNGSAKSRTRKSQDNPKCNEINPDENPTLEQWIPSISHPFWDIYINKLRVTATETGVCDLAVGAEEEVDEDEDREYDDEDREYDDSEEDIFHDSEQFYDDE